MYYYFKKYKFFHYDKSSRDLFSHNYVCFTKDPPLLTYRSTQIHHPLFGFVLPGIQYCRQFLHK
jgi:hypothetical protein